MKNRTLNVASYRLSRNSRFIFKKGVFDPYDRAILDSLILFDLLRLRALERRTYVSLFCC